MQEISFLIAVTSDDALVVFLLFKTETTVTGNDASGVIHLILHTKLMYKKIEVTVNVTTDNKAFAVGKTICLIIRVRHEKVASNREEVCSVLKLRFLEIGTKIQQIFSTVVLLYKKS